MKKFKVAVIGCGGRGLGYTSSLNSKTDRFEIRALCDTDPDQLAKIHNIVGVPNTDDFLDPDEFFAEKRGDLLVIATPDRAHVPMALRALELGYHLLLEKPISDSREELDALLEAQKKTGGKIIVCHELRYGGAYRKCKELLESGIIGRLRAVDASERPYYWHWAQAYVRGIGATLENSHPVILAKCSHDLDLLYYYIDSECDTVSSVGDRSFFIPENAPDGAADRCVDCKHIDSCAFSAKKIYIDMWHDKGEPEFIWPFSKVSLVSPHTEEALMKGIAEGEYGKCAFKCPLDQCDHQFVQAQFKNGVKASLKMIYSTEHGRRFVFYGTLGEIIMDERSDDITVMPYGKEKTVIKADTLIEGGHGHGGGDGIMMNELYEMLSCGDIATSDISHSIEAHLMGIAAEKSRKLGGAIVKVHE